MRMMSENCCNVRPFGRPLSSGVKFGVGPTAPKNAPPARYRPWLSFLLPAWHSLQPLRALTRPGRNVTGVTLDNPELSPKRLSLLKEAVPSASRVGVLVNPDFKASPAMLDETRSAARTLGLDLQVVETRAPEELAKAFDTLSAQRANALAVLADPMFVSQRRRIAELAASHRIPAIYHLRQFVEAGGLMFYGADYAEMFRQVGNYAGRILKGERPAELPVLQSTKFEFVINLHTARALNIEVPAGVLSIVDEVDRHVYIFASSE